ncbi:MAG: hypothetical protein ABEI77_06555 [Halorientalis sp.]
MTRVIADRRLNAVGAWLLAAVLAGLSCWTAVAGSILWTGFTLVCLGLVLTPALVTGELAVMPDAELVGALTVPLIVRTVWSFHTVLVAIVLATLALLVVAEIDAFSSAQFTPWFAVVFVVLTTMAVVGLWAVAQFGSDVFLGTDYLTTRIDLMWKLVTASAVGLGAGVLFSVTLLDRSTDADAAMGR